MSCSISVVLPVYNGARTLVRALSSIAAQTMGPDEVVIVDDGSSDQTPDIICDWSSVLPVKCISFAQNRGYRHALIAGVAAADGELVFRLDADDLWMESHVESIYGLSREHPDAVLFASRAWVTKEGRGNEGKSLTKDVSDDDIRAKLMWDNPIVHSSVAFRREAYLRCGGYLLDHLWEDYDLWIRLLAEGRLAFVDEPTVEYFVSSQSVSRVEKPDALAPRMRLQAKAIRRFFWRHPVFAMSVIPALAMRKMIHRCIL